MHDILKEIVDRRIADIEKLGIDFGADIPETRRRPLHPFLVQKGVILEVKRASPSKGDIAPDLNAAKTALSYEEAGAAAISCLTEKNYFKGNLKDLMSVCTSVDIAVLRKDFLLYPDEVDISYRAGADAVLLIARILDVENMLAMAKRAASYKMTSLIEVRTEEDLEKLAFVRKGMEVSDLQYIVCGVNSRDLRDFSIDLLKPCKLLSKIKAVLGKDARVIFESGIRTPQAASFAGSLGFTGMLLGEAAAKSPSLRKDLVSSFVTATPSRNSRFWQNVVVSIHSLREHSTITISPMVKICGLTTPDDVALADSLGADFVGFIFAAGFARNVCHDSENRFEKIKPLLKNVSAKKVAVITDPESAEAEEAAKLVEQGILDCLQLHGIEYSEVPQSLLKLPHYFVITSKNQNPEKTANELFSMGEPRFLQDSKAHDYQKTDNHLWLAGGITPENTAEFITQFNPELIDLSGGLEFPDQPGKKDPELMKKMLHLYSKRALNYT